ncbi:transporter substrate-binding domain-containing protein [Streptomyces boninensis]|uniref:transporter substrate-binding domain-containing protein n=1 Tax=Streptomyces boninensis TaxID=2039455 RepID=UPI003B2252BC
MIFSRSASRRPTSRYFALLAAALLALAALPACNDSDGDRDDGGDSTGGTEAAASPAADTPVVAPGAQVNVGVIGDLPGWSELDTESNELKGFQADLMYWLEDQLRIRVTPVQVTFEQRLHYMKTHKADIMLANFAMTDERRKDVDIAGPYVFSEQGVMTAKDGPQIRTLKDLGGKSVCTMRGTTSLEQLRDNVAVKKTVVEHAGLSKCVSDLKQGAVDAVVTAQVDLLGYAQKDEDLRLPDVQFGAQDRFGIAVPKGDRESCERLTQALKTFIAKGDWNQYFREHFPDEPITPHRPTPDELTPCDD